MGACSAATFVLSAGFGALAPVRGLLRLDERATSAIERRQQSNELRVDTAKQQLGTYGGAGLEPSTMGAASGTMHVLALLAALSASRAIISDL